MGQMDETAVKQVTRVQARQRKLWWILPLVVLFLLVAAIYVLGHMGSADSEMYPTTTRHGVRNVWLS